MEENRDTRGQGLNRAQTSKRGDPPHHCAIFRLEVSHIFLRTPLASDAVALSLSRVEPHLRYGKLATSHYQLALLALLWLFVMLHLPRPKRAVTAPAAPALPEPRKPKRTRSNELKPFEGLTQKPHCALCAQDTASPKAPPPVPPDPMAPTHRRPREVDTSRPLCPHSDCDSRGWVGLGNLRANGHPSGGPWRQFHCMACTGYFLETHGTLFHGKQAAVELMGRVLACLAEGWGIRATARVFAVDPNTVLHGLVEAAEQLRAFSAYFLCDLHLEQLQLDALYAVLRDCKAGKISDDEAMQRLERSPY